MHHILDAASLYSLLEAPYRTRILFNSFDVIFFGTFFLGLTGPTATLIDAFLEAAAFLYSGLLGPYFFRMFPNSLAVTLFFFILIAGATLVDLPTFIGTVADFACVGVSSCPVFFFPFFFPLQLLQHLRHNGNVVILPRQPKLFRLLMMTKQN